MMNGSTQNVTVKTQKSAEIFIDERFVGKGYSTRNLTRDEPHTISVVHNGCSQTLTTEARFNKVSLLGFLLDLGLFSLPIDFLSGSAWNIYPNKIELTPVCQEQSST